MKDRLQELNSLIEETSEEIIPYLTTKGIDADIILHVSDAILKIIDLKIEKHDLIKKHQLYDGYTCWCLKAVNGFIPNNHLKNGYFGSSESLNSIINCINSNYPDKKYQIKRINDKVFKLEKDVQILIEEVPF